MVSSMVLRPAPAQVLYSLPAEIRLVDNNPYQQHSIDRAVVRFYRALMRSAVVEALKCAKGKAPETPRIKSQRMQVYAYIKTKGFRTMCEGLGYNYENVESTIRGIVAGQDADRAETLLKQYDQEAVFYARRSTGRPPRGKESKVQGQEERRGS